MSGVARGGILAALLLFAATLTDCTRPGPKATSWTWDLPPNFPAPPVPEDNPMTAAKVELGRHLFYDPRLSVTGEMSCATCHRQALAFTDGEALAEGATGERHFRSSMSLANVAYSPRLTWAHPHMDRLEAQMLIPLFGEEPVEMGLSGREEEVLATLRADPTTLARFERAYPVLDAPVTLQTLTHAIAAFQRTLISGRAPYDRFVQGDALALSAAARRGLRLFMSERLECFHCHGGFTFSDTRTHANQPVEEVAFHHTALYNLDGAGAYPASDTGLHKITGQPRDMGRFRAPPLRNVAVTAPYMHDGSIPTLEGVIDHYAEGGRTLTEGPSRGVGAESPLKSEFLPGFVLSDAERADLLAFLKSLTDEAFLTDPRFSDPGT